MKKFLVLASALMMLLVSCGKDNYYEKKIVGRWSGEAREYSVDGETTFHSIVFLTFEEGGTGEYKLMVLLGNGRDPISVTAEFTYIVDYPFVYLDLEGEAIQLKFLEDDTLVQVLSDGSESAETFHKL